MMNALDRTYICQRCGVSAIWTVAEQRAAGGIEPTRRLCPACAQLLPAVSRERGLVKWYNARRAYGFISRPQGEELFFHRSALPADVGALEPNLLVEYSIEHTAKGPQAADVRVLAA